MQPEGTPDVGKPARDRRHLVARVEAGAADYLFFFGFFCSFFIDVPLPIESSLRS